jgi:prepilin-type processing-associated H-X9-DG protein
VRRRPSVFPHRGAELSGLRILERRNNPLEDRSMVGASSNHAGGVNVGFMDGSVKFIKETINFNTWAALATKAGGEVFGASAY